MDYNIAYFQLKNWRLEAFTSLPRSRSSKHTWRAVGFTGEWAQCRFPDQNRQPKFYASKVITPTYLRVGNLSDRGLAKLLCLEPTVILWLVSPLLQTKTSFPDSSSLLWAIVKLQKPICSSAFRSSLFVFLAK